MNSKWVSYLPLFLQRKIEGRQNLQKVINNTGWLLFDKFSRLGVGLIVGVWVARYLGADQFGVMNYAIALTGLFGSIASLGLNSIVIRDLIKSPSTANTTIGTAFILHIIGGVLAFILATSTIFIIRPNDSEAIQAVIILSIIPVFRASDVVKYWFESQTKSKHIVLIENISFIIFSFIKLMLIITKSSLMIFVWVALFEIILVATLLLALFHFHVMNIVKLTATFKKSTTLLKESWPLILGAVASTINMRLDQVMLGSMINNSVVGNYSVAVRISEIWLMAPTIIGASVFPTIVAAKLESEEKYRRHILTIAKYMAIFTLPIALLISIASNDIVAILYGNNFTQAGEFLSIHIWTGVPYLIFFVFNQMYYIENLVIKSFYIGILIVVSNVILNFLLIPGYGGVGAAVASLITAIGSSLLSLLILNANTGIFWGLLREKK